jgi:phage terminase Nu1 subunit (DNA packaging protein)
MHKPPPRPPTQAALAADLGVSLRTLQNWKREGIDLTDRKALEARAAASKGKLEAGEDYSAARLRKLRAEADRQETLAKREAGELVLASGIHAEGAAIGRAVRNGLDRMEGDLPGRLAGRTAGEIRKILHATFRELLNEMADRPSDKFLKIP